MKAWSQPEMEELNVRATAYSPKGGLIEDGVYQSDDGKYTIPTYGPSSGNSGSSFSINGVIRGKPRLKMPEWIREAHGYMGFFGVYDESACSINRRRQSV